MHIDQLTYFLQVIEHGSVNSVADKFFMTPQAINASLRKLEAEFGSPLLERSKRGITLTPQGHIFAEYARKTVEQYQNIQLSLRAYNNETSNLAGTLSIFSASIYTELFLPSLIRDFTQIYPNSNIKVMTVNALDILPYFFGGYCNIAFLTAGKAYLEDALRSHGDESTKLLPLLNDRSVLCAHPTHPLMRIAKIDAAKLEEYVKNNNNPISFYHILALNSEGIMYPKTISDAGSAELHKKLMLENNVVTCMPKMAYQSTFQSDGFSAIPLGEHDTIVHALLYRNDPASDTYELTRIFVQSLQHQFAKKYGVYKETE